MNDLKFALRQLLKNFGFTAVACLCAARRQAVHTLAPGIGGEHGGQRGSNAEK